jgi:Flp pilus assembly protein TadD
LPDAWRGLGHALHSQDRAAEAEGCFRRALEIQPNHSQALLELGQVLLQLWRPAEAEPLLRRAIELQPDFAQAYSSLGSCLAEQGLLQQAEACYRRAIALAPDYAASYSNLGSLLMDFGHLAQAQQALTRAIELDPAAAAPLANALLYLPYRRDDAHFQQLDTLYAQRQTLTRQDRILLNFAMGRAMEQSGEYPRAFAAFAEGNRLCHETRPYDQAGHARLVDSSRAFYSAQLFDACSAAQTSLADLPDARVPVFIVGMPRAGSTLIEQILASHPALHGAGELPLIAGMVEQAQQLLRAQPQPQQALGALRQLGRDYLEQLWQRAPQATHISDKMPENYLHLGLIRLMLPQARIIHALRDPMDTCFSCYALLFKYRHEFSYDMTTLGNYFLAYQTLMRHWHQTLPKGWIVDAHYEDTVADPERQARRLLAHLDLPWDDACLNFHESRRTVQTASVAQVRQPIYSTSIARWRHFEAYLEPLRQIIQA